MFKFALLLVALTLLIASNAAGHPVKTADRKAASAKALKAMLAKLHAARSRTEASRKVHKLRPLIGFAHSFGSKSGSKSRYIRRPMRVVKDNKKVQIAALLKLLEANREKKLKN